MPRDSLAAASRDGHLALRRVERQQAVIERLHAARGARLQLADLARDVERLRDSGVPIVAHPGRGGGVSLPRVADPAPIRFDLPEAAALISSLAVLGPTVSPSAASAMRKLAAAVSG